MSTQIIRRPTDQGWETHKQLLKRLYLKENKPLHEVMAFMEREHGFIAKYVRKINPRVEAKK
jgi:hypothetical protein